MSTTQSRTRVTDGLTALSDVQRLQLGEEEEFLRQRGNDDQVRTIDEEVEVPMSHTELADASALTEGELRGVLERATGLGVRSILEVLAFHA